MAVHPTAIVEPGVVIGRNTAIWDNVHIRHSTTHRRRLHHRREELHRLRRTTSSDLVKINAFVYVCTGVTIEHGVMIAAGVVFTNDRFPRATTPDLDRLLPSDPDEHTLPTLVGEGATIGAHATIGPGLKIGRFAMVGMGSVVTRDVPDFAIVRGNPASPVGYACACGQPLVPLSDRGRGRRSLRCHVVPRPNTRSRARPWRRWDCSRPAMTRFGIVGGGILGMTLGVGSRQGRPRRHDLRRRRRAAAAWPAPWELGDVVWDRHYHVTLAQRSRAARALARARSRERAAVGQDRDRLLRRRQDAPVLGSARLPALSAPVVRCRSSDSARRSCKASRIERLAPLERLTAVDWLTRHCGRATVEQIWLPLLRAKLGPHATRASAAFIWAIIARMYAARRSGRKRELFGYVRGGYDRTLRRFEERLAARGVEIRDVVPDRTRRSGAPGGIAVVARLARASASTASS